MIITETNIEKAKQMIKKSGEKPIIVKAYDDKFNRSLLEYGKFDILLSPEAGERKTKLRQEDSGFNHVLAKIAVKNGIAIGLDLEEISALEKNEKARRLSKIRQNVKICRKAKTKIVLVGAKNKREAISLMLSLGASTQQAKEAAQSF
jgi:ribonuclease P/MRP protein subunit RPP1